MTVSSLSVDPASEQAINDVRDAAYRLWKAVYDAIPTRLTGRDAEAARVAVGELHRTGRVDDVATLAESLGCADALVRTWHGIYLDRRARCAATPPRLLPAVAPVRSTIARQPWITTERVDWQDGCVSHTVIRHRFRGRPLGRWS